MPPIYFDCNATTPVDPEVIEVLLYFLEKEYGNEGSRTHEYGVHAKSAVQNAREQIAQIVSAKRDEVIFTSGATESNNLAIQGVRLRGKELGKLHIITTSIEHKAVLEPCNAMAKDGFEITYLPVTNDGFVDPLVVKEALRPDTLLVSIMHVNNETGVRQPLVEIAEILADHEAYFHTDAAQGFGKDFDALRNPRIDFISISGHKIFAPKGVGALITRRRGYERPPLKPLMYGGGQERGLRPGTLPVPLIAALGKAAEISLRDKEMRASVCRRIREAALEALTPFHPRLVGEQNLVLNHTLNLSFPRVNSEAMIVALKGLIAISNGSACTSNNYSPSHVLKAMGMNDDEANTCIRLSWCHLTENVNWEAITDQLKSILLV